MAGEQVVFADLSYKIIGIAPAHRAQTLNYLAATNHQLAIIINFGKKSLAYERLANTQK